MNDFDIEGWDRLLDNDWISPSKGGKCYRYMLCHTATYMGCLACQTMAISSLISVGQLSKPVFKPYAAVYIGDVEMDTYCKGHFLLFDSEAPNGWPIARGEIYACDPKNVIRLANPLELRDILDRLYPPDKGANPAVKEVIGKVREFIRINAMAICADRDDGGIEDFVELERVFRYLTQLEAEYEQD